jgi:biotin carboxylase
MTKTIIQVSHSNDGLRNYVRAAHAKSYKLVLIYGSDAKGSYERGNSLGEPDFDEAIALPDSEPETFLRMIEEIGDRQQIGLIVPGSELYTPLAAQASETLGLPTPGVATVEKFRHKGQQREALHQVGLAHWQPQSISCHNLSEMLAAIKTVGFPAVIKPDDSGGSMGVQKVASINEGKEAFLNLQGLKLDNGSDSNGTILVEECIDGPEIELEGVVDAEGNVTVLSMVKKTMHGGDKGDRFMEKGFILYPQPAVLTKAREAAEQIIKGLGLKASPFHMDMRLSSQGPKLIEAGARMSGAFIQDLVQRATGWNWATAALDVMLGQPLQLPPCANRYSGLEFITPENAGHLGAYHLSLSSLCLAQGEDVAVNLFTSDRSFVGGYHHFSDRIGLMRVMAASPERVSELIETILSSLRVASKS